MPNGPISREISRKDTGDAVTIGLVLAAVVATLVLFGPVLLKSEQKSMDVVATQPTDSPIKAQNGESYQIRRCASNRSSC